MMAKINRPPLIVQVKYPKGCLKLANQIIFIAENSHPDVEVLRHRFGDKRGVHTRNIFVCIKHKYGLLCVVRKIKPSLKQVGNNVIVITKLLA